VLGTITVLEEARRAEARRIVTKPLRPVEASLYGEADLLPTLVESHAIKPLVQCGQNK
jgi:hypothetical protein